jgi:hypothetical protein
MTPEKLCVADQCSERGAEFVRRNRQEFIS